MSVLISAQLAYPGLGLLVAGESMGLLVPGETALLVTAVLAHQGRLQIGAVIGVAALAAILGDNAGYLLGRAGLRNLLAGRSRPGSLRDRALERGEALFAVQGARAVFLARWVVGARVAAAWLAGTSRMPWRRFLLWNTLGGIAWSVSIGLTGYALGAAAGKLLSAGAAVTIVALAACAALLGVMRHRRTRLHGREPARPPTA